MKTINVTFEDKEYRDLLKKKNGKNWHDFIMEKVLKWNAKESLRYIVKENQKEQYKESLAVRVARRRVKSLINWMRKVCYFSFINPKFLSGF